VFELERQDVQGLVVSSYSKLPCAAYLLLRINNPSAARKWLSQHVADITTSENKPALFNTNLAFTGNGLRNLGLSEKVLNTFSRPFQEGMATAHRQRVLGDQEENEPAKWAWGGRENNQVDALLLIYATDEDVLKAQLQQRRQQLADPGFSEVAALSAGRQPDSHEHFGFNDGIGQPVMEGTGNKQRQLDRTNHATELPAGEFLMSYTNVYGVAADSPVVAAADDPRNLLPDVPDESTSLHAQSKMHDLGRNGSYLVFRHLAQDVAKFWNFLDKATNHSSDPKASERLAAKFVGRWKSGAPLVLSPEEDNALLKDENNFAYLEKDAQGLSCPIGSHIRRSNPRDSLGPDAATALTSANRHRILRRGRSYGPHAKDPRAADGIERGLIFICLNSDIERQFEFVQQTWINNPVFGGLAGEVDPLIGNLPKGDCIFTVPGQPLRTRVHGLSRFVTVKGGAYFFLPSIRALNYLASL
jgi:Dyp-type peroxidase family